VNAGRRDLSGTVVLVTGAGAGIGAATVQMLVAEGACVVAADRDPLQLRTWVADLTFRRCKSACTHGGGL
jgi:NAD(P)-dependent dehydrogenase (short-subunit alcohol dehydrogenase family)